MAKTLTLELLRNIWLMSEASIEMYSIVVADYLAGKEISTGFFSSLQLPDVPKNVALIPIAGVLTKSDICGGKGSRSLAFDVARSAADQKIDSIILMFENCPGGQVDGTQELADAVIKAKTKKPVMGAISGTCCSAGVWINSHTTESYCTALTDMVGCIGVMGRIRNPDKAEKKPEDYIEVISDLSPDKNADMKDISIYKEQIINPLCKIFHDNVKAGRGDKLKLSKEDVLTGKTYLAQSAKEFGLTDGIMPFDKIVHRSLSLAKSIR
jgi:ClpP class serine protease